MQSPIDLTDVGKLTSAGRVTPWIIAALKRSVFLGKFCGAGESFVPWDVMAMPPHSFISQSVFAQAGKTDVGRLRYEYSEGGSNTSLLTVICGPEAVTRNLSASLRNVFGPPSTELMRRRVDHYPVGF
jgi:hypothetical protein